MENIALVEYMNTKKQSSIPWVLYYKLPNETSWGGLSGENPANHIDGYGFLTLPYICENDLFDIQIIVNPPQNKKAIFKKPTLCYYEAKQENVYMGIVMIDDIEHEYMYYRL